MSALPAYTTRVRDEWIDYNGHLSEAYYVLVFGFATDQVMDHLGLDENYRATTGCSLYTVEAHVRYLDEVSPGATLTVTTTIVDAGPKKLHLAHEMRVDGSDAEPDGEPADAAARPVCATEELLALHVGEAGSLPFPEAVTARIEEHRVDTDPPQWVGRRVNPGASTPAGT